MLSADLKTVLDDLNVAEQTLSRFGLIDIGGAQASLVNIARQGVPLDLLEEIVRELARQLPAKPDPDLGLKNLERFIAAARSPMSLAALLVRDPAALSALLDIFSFSASLSNLLVEDPESFDLIRLTDGQPVAREVLLQELQVEIQHASSMRVAKNRLRRFKRRELLRIAYGDLVRKFGVERTAQQLAYLAESIAEVALEYSLQRVAKKFGRVRGRNGQICPVTLIGSGRLGARNLDYSPLLSVWCIFGEGRESDGKQKLLATDYFKRVMDEFEDLLSEANEYGACYQVRFERRVGRGSSKACSLRELIKFYDQAATARDRLDLVQSTFLCGDRELAGQFQEARRQICFRGYFSPNDLAEIQSLKHGLNPRGPDKHPFRNLKTSAGGLHDLEFTVNFLQLLVGKKIPEARDGSFFDAIYQLEQHEVLTRQEYSRLKENYAGLKTIAHRLQLVGTQPTDVLPKKHELKSRLEKHLKQHFSGSDGFGGLEKISKLAEENLAMLAHLLQWEPQERRDPWKDFVLAAEAPEENLLRDLEDLGFQHAETALKAIGELATERHRFISSKRCRFFLASIIADLLQRISQTADPDETLSLLVSVSDSLGGKGTLWELFRQNPSCMHLYVDLCANTPYLAAILQSHPGMLDELMDSLTTERQESAEDYRRELDRVCGSSRDVQPIVVAFKNSKHLQIGVSQLLGIRDLSDVHAALTQVADCCIQKIAGSEWKLLVEKHGRPEIAQPEGETTDCEYGVVVSGKIGAGEPNYHSHALFWILYAADGQTRAGRNQKSITNQQFFGLLATRIAKALTQNGPQGRLYELEELPAELGDSRTTALSLDALATRCRKNCDSAALMMFLGLCRVLGDQTAWNDKAQSLIRDLMIESRLDRTSWEAAWNQRLRLEQGASRFNLKRGVGGTLDVETAVHFLYTAEVQHLEPTTHTVTMLDRLIKRGIVEATAGEVLRRGFEQFKRIELFLRLMNLPRRHALPILVSADEAKGTSIGDGEISLALKRWRPVADPDDSAIRLAGQQKSGSLLEATDPQMVAVQQMRLATLMKYDRFDALRDEVEQSQQDHRRWVESLVDQYLDSRD